MPAGSPSPTGPPRMMKPSSTRPSMKAACSSQPCCSLIGREASQPGPCTSRTAKLATAVPYRPPPTIPPGPARRQALAPGDDPAVRAETEPGQAEPLVKQGRDLVALHVRRLRAGRRAGYGEQRAGEVMKGLPPPVIVADRHDQPGDERRRRIRAHPPVAHLDVDHEGGTRREGVDESPPVRAQGLERQLVIVLHHP